MYASLRCDITQYTLSEHGTHIQCTVLSMVRTSPYSVDVKVSGWRALSGLAIILSSRSTAANNAARGSLSMRLTKS